VWLETIGKLRNRGIAVIASFLDVISSLQWLRLYAAVLFFGLLTRRLSVLKLCGCLETAPKLRCALRLAEGVGYADNFEDQ
jgi:hypothetical protein